MVARVCAVSGSGWCLDSCSSAVLALGLWLVDSLDDTSRHVAKH